MHNLLMLTMTQHSTKKLLMKTQINGLTLLQPKKVGKNTDKADAIKTLVSVYQTNEVGKYIEEASDGADIPAWDGATPSSSSSDDD